MQRADRRSKQNECQGQPVVPGIVFTRLAAAVLIIMLVSGGWVMTAEGQAAASLTVSSPRTNAFPEISVEFKLTDSTGHPIRNLDASQLTVIENENELPVSSLSEAYQGIRFALVINGDRELDIRDASGTSRYEKMSDSLQAWAAGWHFSGEDSWSLMTNSGLEVGDASEAVTWITALAAYQPNFRQLETELTSLQEAVQMLQRDDVSFGVDKAILYLTPPPTPDQIAGINALAEQARQTGIQVNVWMVGEAHYLTNDQGGSLVEMAASTGGEFFHYIGDALPDFTGTLNALGYSSELTYKSALRQTETYPLAIRAVLADMEVTGESLPFYVDVQPPNPMLLAPPVRVVREAVTDEDVDPVSYAPSQVDLGILVEYPDGHLRELVASRLLVDGSVVDANASAPFDTFSWDITELVETGEHTIQVEVEDSLGFRAATLLTPVRVEIDKPLIGASLSLQQIGLIASGVIAAAGLVLFGVWLFRKFRYVNRSRRDKREADSSAKESSPSEDVAGEERCYAILLPLDSLDEPGEETGLVVNKRRVLIGSDPQQVGLLISDPEVEPVQAELVLEEDVFWLRAFDATERRTWLNYQPIGSDLVRVRPGDLLHFGESGFRFTMEVEETDKKISVTRYEPFT